MRDEISRDARVRRYSPRSNEQLSFATSRKTAGLGVVSNQRSIRSIGLTQPARIEAPDPPNNSRGEEPSN